jgi:hypothetical protein
METDAITEEGLTAQNWYPDTRDFPKSVEV